MERVVTEEIMRYREALRLVWNNCIWVDPKQRHWDAVSDFEELESVLFDVLVCRPLGLQFRGVFGPAFRLLPMSVVSESFGSIQVDMSSQKTPGGCQFKVVLGPFPGDDLKVSVVGFFDWLASGYRDFRYFMVRIDSFSSHPELVGRLGLVEVFLADVSCEVPEPRERSEPPQVSYGSPACKLGVSGKVEGQACN